MWHLYANFSQVPDVPDYSKNYESFQEDFRGGTFSESVLRRDLPHLFITEKKRQGGWIR